jgi:hypothetical protein
MITMGDTKATYSKKKMFLNISVGDKVMKFETSIQGVKSSEIVKVIRVTRKCVVTQLLNYDSHHKSFFRKDGRSRSLRKNGFSETWQQENNSYIRYII